MSDPSVEPDKRELLVKQLMTARRAVAKAIRASDQAREDATHADVNQQSVLWASVVRVRWGDGAPELNRHLAHTAPYAGLKADR